MRQKRRRSVALFGIAGARRLDRKINGQFKQTERREQDSGVARTEASMAQAAAIGWQCPNRGFTLIYAGLRDFLRNPQKKFAKGVICLV